MSNVRISRHVCAVIGEVIAGMGSHAVLDALFLSSGAPEPPPDLAHHTKWKTWLFQVGADENVDSLAVLGNIIEEFMDVEPPDFSDSWDYWHDNRKKIVDVLESNGLRYFRGGRILPDGEMVVDQTISKSRKSSSVVTKPKQIEDLLTVVLKGLRRAMYPLTNRRKGAQVISFNSEYDVQDLFHSLLRPWVADIRPEEFTPSYAGSSTRMDFLLPAHSIVIELKFVRDRSHGKKIGDELIIDIEHYTRHPDCKTLWCVIYDPNHFLLNAEGLKSDLEGTRGLPDGELETKVLVL